MNLLKYVKKNARGKTEKKTPSPTPAIVIIIGLCSPQIKSPSPSPWTKWTTSWLETCVSSRTERSPSPLPSTTPASTSATQTSPSTGTLGTRVEPSFPESWPSLTHTLPPARSSLRWWSRRSSQTRPATHQLIPRPKLLVHLLIREPQVGTNAAVPEKLLDFRSCDHSLS